MIPPSTANRATVGKASVPSASSATSSTASASSPRTGRSSRASRNPGSGAVGSSPPSRGLSRAGGSAATAASSSGVGGAAPAAAAGRRPGRRPARHRPVAGDRARTAPQPARPGPTRRGSGHSSGVDRRRRPAGPLAARGVRPAPNSSRNSAQRSVSSASVPTSTSRPRVQHGDPVGQRQRRAAVRDQQRGAAGGEPAQRLVDRRLGHGVHRGHRVVEHQHPRVGEHGPGQRDPLPLAAGQRQPALADHGVVALGQLARRTCAPGRPGPRPRSRRRLASGRP